MTNREKLSEVFGPIQKSGWQEAAEVWETTLPWRKHAQRIALEVLEYLSDAGMSQKDFAQKIGVTPQVVSRWLKGGENFTLETISKIEQGLGFDLLRIEAVGETTGRLHHAGIGMSGAYPAPATPAPRHLRPATRVIEFRTSYPSPIAATA